MSYKQLTENERYQIYTLLKVGFSLKAISAELGRHPSTVKQRAKITREPGETALKSYHPGNVRLSGFFAGVTWDVSDGSDSRNKAAILCTA